MSLDGHSLATISTGLATSGVGWLTYLQEIQALVGITAGIVGMLATVVMLYFAWRRHERESKR